jgi:hypothetical protein
MVSTLGEAHDLGWRIRARCIDGTREAGPRSTRECQAVVSLDLTTLVWTRGRAFPIGRLAERLRCSVCGSRDIAVYFEPSAATTRARG